MDTAYTLSKFLHIVGAIIWIGGVTAVFVINARLAREQDYSTLAAMTRQSRFFGAAIVGPAALITLIAGIVMVAVSGLGAPLWVVWGFAAIVLSIALGASFIRITYGKLEALTGTPSPDAARVFALQGRLGVLNGINLLLLLSTVWAMVFKPTL